MTFSEVGFDKDKVSETTSASGLESETTAIVYGLLKACVNTHWLKPCLSVSSTCHHCSLIGYLLWLDFYILRFSSTKLLMQPQFKTITGLRQESQSFTV